MKNRIYKITKKDLSSLMQNFKTSYIVTLEGREIKNLKELLNELSIKYCFPIPSQSLDGALDWLLDLDWLHSSDFY